ncbi:MAG TPA: UDP-N-acetylglucosamine--N-acetylmuramyl-(pentapeptide) pyrophosphoryl-undecaprenol N-acetylglucosamine transferase [Alphaproteobacteria bacterium]|nr:UDP-N-acetylglucosamine--N-acetylmuramyl-(pentapeptide) pyrophosphoryl-undecaprenol N-acetylglucosamine transferase [Alphaproteobacteria bacterium]
MNENPPLIVLAAGGTGGHVFPAEALARELLGRGLRVALFTDRRGDAFGGDLPVPASRIRASSLGKGLIGKLRSIVEMGIGVLQARGRLRRLKPAAVVGFGGYPSVPTLYTAAQLDIPIVIHEQNAVLGRANRAMMGKARAIATSFPHVVGLKPGSQARLVQTGNPVRPAFASLRAVPYPALADDEPMRLLVLGGSLGARVFSQVVPQAIALMPDHLRRRLIVAQQCRKEDIEAARAGFAGAGVEAELSPFFRDVPERLAQSHLFIGRSGGSTVAELTAIGRPSILVPFPHGHAGEQIANAEAVAEAGGAWLIPEQAFTPEALAVRLESLMALPSALAKTAAAARAWGNVTAADNLADCVAEVIGLKGPARGSRIFDADAESSEKAASMARTGEQAA